VAYGLNTNILQHLRNEVKNLTAAQSSIVDYILKNPTESAFLTIEQLARKVGTSTTTIMRLALNVGYKGYVEFQKDLQDLLRSQVPQVRLKINLQETDKDDLLIKSGQTQINNISGTIEDLSDDTLKEVVQHIISADKIFCTGFRKSYSIAYFLQQGLNRIIGKTRLLMTSDGDLFEQLLDSSSGDLLIAVSFPRYSQPVIDLVKQAKLRNIKVVSITDSYSSPLVPYSDIVLPCRYESIASHNSMIGAMFVADYLISAVSFQLPEETSKRLDEVEGIQRAMYYHPSGSSN
jgi:DNA-binding MurR/RpiR family transcriptional regulator